MATVFEDDLNALSKRMNTMRISEKRGRENNNNNNNFPSSKRARVLAEPRAQWSNMNANTRRLIYNQLGKFNLNRVGATNSNHLEQVQRYRDQRKAPILNMRTGARHDMFARFTDNQLNALALTNKNHLASVNTYRRRTMTPEKMIAHIENMKRQGRCDMFAKPAGFYTDYRIPGNLRANYDNEARVENMMLDYGNGEMTIIYPDRMTSFKPGLPDQDHVFPRRYKTMQGLLGHLTTLYNEGMIGRGRAPLRMRGRD